MKVKHVDYTPNYIMVRMAQPLNLPEMFDADVWCCSTKAGKRVNRHSFAFKTEAEFTMFTLRWIK